MSLALSAQRVRLSLERLHGVGTGSKAGWRLLERDELTRASASFAVATLLPIHALPRGKSSGSWITPRTDPVRKPRRSRISRRPQLVRRAESARAGEMTGGRPAVNAALENYSSKVTKWLAISCERQVVNAAFVAGLTIANEPRIDRSSQRRVGSIRGLTGRSSFKVVLSAPICKTNARRMPRAFTYFFEQPGPDLRRSER